MLSSVEILTDKLTHACWTFIVVHTSMPASSRNSTSSQRLVRAEPGMLVCANSSTNAISGLRRNWLDLGGARALGEHVVRRLSASFSRYRDAQLSAPRLHDSRPTSPLLARSCCPGRLPCPFADRLRRRNGSANPVVCHRGLSCLHALAGRYGHALETTGRQRLTPTHDHQRRWGFCYRVHPSRKALGSRPSLLPR